MTGFLGALGVLGAIVLFVAAHEAGHYFAAKATGMKVTEFFIGFGPRIWSFKRGDTEYGIKPIPAGAYVKIVGMSDMEEVDPADEGRTYRSKPFWQKSIVVLAGVAANFVLAFFLFFGLALWSGEQVATTTVDELVVIENGAATAAEAAGIRPGDSIVSFDGVPATDWDVLQDAVAASQPGDTVDVVVERSGERLVLTATLGARSDDPSVGQLGILPRIIRESIGVPEAAGLSASEIGRHIGGAFQLFARVFRFDSLSELAGGIAGNEVSDDIRPVSIVGLVQLGSQADALGGLPGLIYLLGLVNVVLGTINALPLPPLDGGHFAVALFEKVTKRKADMRALIPVAVFVIGALSILGVMTIILDIVNPIEIPS
jgi:membrane-associated protease RseP (regulator of RpoE activity)